MIQGTVQVAYDHDGRICEATVVPADADVVLVATDLVLALMEESVLRGGYRWRVHRDEIAATQRAIRPSGPIEGTIVG